MRIYTDGASSPDGCGGWAWVSEDGEYESGAEHRTTNNRMEIYSVIAALRANANRPLTIVSDSQYVVNCINQRWYVKWRRNGWKSSKKEPVLNVDLWNQLLDLIESKEEPVVFEWVRGHSGNELNDKADMLAVKAKKELQNAR